ncbi:mediator of RNA polymerase II transcription subunit 30 isoform X1 [Trichechus manatus latirostris]|uniref:Mediator of RNA polymerase II transcription subunit 30 n=1 Tax=Trichechus manatus latirostris TaxID=127582 RepID=A0A2Y9QX36_TRIMA|nr:mediator of RNA polymerase II transcription subunit 30 isoform X1 [Trichechus manatus latirostris]
MLRNCFCLLAYTYRKSCFSLYFYCSVLPGKLPNGVTYHTGTYQDRLTKLQDHLRQLSILFRKLRLVYDKCNENCGGMDPIPVEQLIPYVEEDGSKNDDRAGLPRFASEERREIAEVNKSTFNQNKREREEQASALVTWGRYESKSTRQHITTVKTMKAKQRPFHVPISCLMDSNKNKNTGLYFNTVATCIK